MRRTGGHPRQRDRESTQPTSRLQPRTDDAPVKDFNFVSLGTAEQTKSATKKSLAPKP